MIDTFHSLQLREEARKSWDYFLTYEFVYSIEATKVNGEIYCGYIKRYIGSDFYIELTFIHGHNLYSVAIIESPRTENSVKITKFDHSLGETGNNLSVLIDAVKFMKPPEMFNLRPIPSIIRLKTFYDRMGTSGNVLHFPLSPTMRVYKLRGVIKDGKLCGTFGFIGGKQCKLPSQVVKCRPKIMGKITHDKAPLKRQCLIHLKPKDIARFFGIILSNELTWFGLRSPESPNFPVEEIEMFLRPDDLEPNAVERMHVVSSVNEEM